MNSMYQKNLLSQKILYLCHKNKIMNFKILSPSIIHLFFLFSLMSLLSGCIQITQEITIKKNGSGKVIFTIDMSELQKMMSAFDSNKSSNAEFGDKMKEQLEKLKQIHGIQKVAFSDKDMVYKYQFSFKNLQSLNDALKLLNGGKDEKITTYVQFNNNQIILKNPEGLNPEIGSNDTKDNQGGDTVIEDKQNNDKNAFDNMGRELFKDSYFTTIINAPAPISGCSFADAQLSNKSKKVTIKIPLLDLEKPENQKDIIVKLK